MAPKGYYKCCGCERFVNTEHDQEWYTFATLPPHRGKLVCSACEEADLASPVATIVHYKPGEWDPHKVVVGDLLAVDYTYGEEVDECSEYWDIVQCFSWVRTDPWRGYYDLTRVPKGWVMLLDTWYGIDGENLPRGVKKRFAYREDTPRDLPAECILIHLRTSNVCTSGLVALVREEDKAPMRKYLDLEEAA